MVETFDRNITRMYLFRFGTSNKLIQLTQQQLDRIPYLSTVVANEEKFLSIRNENDEYVLNPPIHYNLVTAILHSIFSEQPYMLFDKLPVDDNVLDLLQLFDYFCVNSFPLPVLKDEHLARSNPGNNDNEKGRIEYHQASVLEARQTAAEFIIALSKNEYNLDDSKTINRIFSLTMVIFSNEAVFSSRFRHHTLAVLKESCYSRFSKGQQRLLPATQQIAQYTKIDSFKYLYNDDKLVPVKLLDAFAWRGVGITIKQNDIGPLFTNANISFNFRNPSYNPFNFSMFWPWPMKVKRRRKINRVALAEKKNVGKKESPIYQTKKGQKNNEAQSARSERFNTLPKQHKIDKYKHRSGPKAQKHR